MTHIEETIQKTVKQSRQKNICNSSKNSKIEIITKKSENTNSNFKIIKICDSRKEREA